MKIIAERAALLASLTLATNIVHKRNISEILGYVLIDGMMGEARFRATDLDLEASTHCAADVADPGMVTADAVRLREIVQACGSQITLEHGLCDDPRLVISSGKSRFRIPTLPVSDFPTIPDEDWTATYTLKAIDLKELLEGVSYAVSKDVQGQYFLTGVRLEAEGGSLVAIGTNRHRIAKSFVELPHGASKAPGVTVPPKMATQIVIACADAIGDATVCVSQHKLRVTVGKTQITSKVIDADYLDVSRAIPQSTPLTAKANKDALVKTIQRARLTGDPGKEGEGVKLTFRDGLLTVTGRSPVADGCDEMEIGYVGPEYSVGVTGRYALEALSAIQANAVDLGFGEGVPALKITSTEDPSVIMTVGLRMIP